MKPILIFGGTSEGRRLAELTTANEILTTISVATEYGEEVLVKHPLLTIFCERMDEKQMEAFLLKEDYSVVVDATHPYAVEVSENIEKACQNMGRNYIRMRRPKNPKYEHSSKESLIIPVPDATSAANYLNKQNGTILLTTGSKDLPVFMEHINEPERIFARVLPSEESIRICQEAGLERKQIIAMQGPFSVDLNCALIEQIHATCLVTKEGGTAGGFPEKIMAAKKMRIPVILLTRPKEEMGYSFEEVIRMLQLNEESTVQREVYLAGIGMGTKETMTKEVMDTIDNCDVVIGAKRILSSDAFKGKETFCAYDSKEIHQFIETHESMKKIFIALSGDVGFYSGASGLLTELKDYSITLLPGISSVVYFASKLKMTWQDMKLVSLHGRHENLVGAVLKEKKVCCLVGGMDGAAKLAGECKKFGLESLPMYVGTNLSYKDETIEKGCVSDFLEYSREGISIVLIENPLADQKILTSGITDDAFIRGNVPMTKEEIRSISVSKLQLTAHSVVYDIGAGTGSVSVECARLIPEGSVYAIEKNSEAVTLIEKNKYAFGTWNLNIVKGTAPEAIEALATPTHAFVGGSTGHLREIIDCLFRKNPSIRIVINAIAMETIAEITEIMKDGNFAVTDVVLVAAGKAKELGAYHMMMGMNPVWIVTLQKDMAGGIW